MLLGVYALQSGGEPGARLLKSGGTKVSPDTLLRLAQALMTQDVAAPALLGVDAFAFCRGQQYGTLLLDWARHRPIDLLPDRTAETEASWLRAHPGLKWIRRARCGEYARGASQGAPEAKQILDRWHVIKNWREALERLVSRVYARLELRQPPPSSTPFPKCNKARTIHEQAAAFASRQHRLTRYEEVLECSQQGMALTQIAEHLHVCRGTGYT